MNAQGGVPSQPRLWMIRKLVSQHRAAVSVKGVSLSESCPELPSSQVASGQLGLHEGK